VHDGALEGGRLPVGQMRASRLSGGVISVCCGLFASCGSKGAVDVTASATNLTVAIDRASPLAARLQGGFDLQLELGQYAPEGTNIDRHGSFQLVRPADQSGLTVLNVYASAPFPYHLEPGDKATIHFTIGDNEGTPGQTVPQDVQAALCQAGSVALAGQITDTAAARSTPLGGSATAVAGCP
jgi:hypothetical protein